MKRKVTTILILAALVMGGCSSNDCTTVEKELTQLKKEVTERDSLMSVFGSAIAGIDSNVILLGELEQDLTESLKSPSKEKEARVGENVEKLRNLMALNQDYIEQLENTLNMNNNISKNLFGIVKTMEHKIAKSNMRLARHSGELEELGEDFRNLFDEYMQAEYAKMELEESMNALEGNMDEMESKMQELKKSLNTAYYAIGTKKELIEKGVLEKGGLLKSKEMNEDADKSAFKSIDVRKTSSISINSDKLKFVSEHPSDSYKINAGNMTIEILDTQKFWSISKYLIVIED